MTKPSLKKILLLGLVFQIGAVIMIVLASAGLIQKGNQLVASQQRMMHLNESSVSLMMLANEKTLAPSLRVKQQWEKIMQRAKRQVLDAQANDKSGQYHALLFQLNEINEFIKRTDASAVTQKIHLALQPTLVARIYNLLALNKAVVSQLEKSYLSSRFTLLMWIGFISLLALAFPLLFLVIILKKIIAPIQSLVDSTGIIAEKNFTQVVPETNLQELDALVAAMNSMRVMLLNEMSLKSDLLIQVEQRALAESEALGLVAELKKSQFQMLKMEKLSALGVMVGGVAHELNNPLMGVHNYVEYSLTKIKEPKVVEILERAMVELERMQHLVTNMLIFSRTKQDVGLEVVSLFNLVDSIVAVMEPDLKKHSISLRNEIPPELYVSVNSDILKQVLLNLISNARDALKESPKREVAITSQITADNIVIVSVTDTGCGISDENIKNIFDPFFTTKPVGQGTGLGLSISLTLMQQLDSELTLESTSPLGSTFSLPLKVAIKT